MTPKQEAMKLAQELGVEVIEGCMDICLEAPKYKVFASCRVHGTVHDYSGDPEGKTGGWKAARDELRAGIEDCQDKGHCEVCDE